MGRPVCITIPSKHTFHPHVANGSVCRGLPDRGPPVSHAGVHLRGDSSGTKVSTSSANCGGIETSFNRIARGP